MPRYAMKRSRGAPRRAPMFSARTSIASDASSGSHPQFIGNRDRRRDRLLKRLLGIARKLLQLGEIADSDMQFVLAISCRDPRNLKKGYNCFATDSNATPEEALLLWNRRLALDAKRDERQFAIFGPNRNSKSIPATLFSFPHKALYPDSKARGYPDDDDDDEDLWKGMEFAKDAERRRSGKIALESLRAPASRDAPSDGEGDYSDSDTGPMVRYPPEMFEGFSSSSDSSSCYSSASESESEPEPLPRSRGPNEARKALQQLIDFLKAREGK